MLHRFKVCLILVLVLFLLNQACEGSSLGMTVHVVPLDSSGGNTVSKNKFLKCCTDPFKYKWLNIVTNSFVTIF